MIIKININLCLFFFCRKKNFEMERNNSGDVMSGANDEIKKEEIQIKLDDDLPVKIVNKLNI